MAAFSISVPVIEATSVEVPRITVEQVKQMANQPDVVIIDVRSSKAWWRSAAKIARAVREEPGAEQQWASKYAKDKTLIFYCT